jgi:hypothetical protein
MVLVLAVVPYKKKEGRKNRINDNGSTNRIVKRPPLYIFN